MGKRFNTTWEWKLHYYKKLVELYNSPAYERYYKYLVLAKAGRFDLICGLSDKKEKDAS